MASFNLINVVKSDCKLRKTVIDIGCKNGNDLFLLSELGFEKLIGIDQAEDTENLCDNALYQFLMKINSEKEEREVARIYKSERNKFNFITEDYANYDFEKENYSCVICSNFLHFIDHKKQLTFIKRLYDLLEPGGLFYIKIHHDLNSDYTNGKSVKIVNGEYEFPDGQKRYPVNEEDFKRKMSAYGQLEHYYDCSEEGIRIILKK